MVRVAVFAAVLGLLPSTFGFDTLGEATCTGKALGYLACRRHLPPICVAEVAAQASAFCRSYLSLTATSVETDVTFVTTTIINFNTVETTVVKTSTSTTETTTTETFTTTTATTSTTNIATSYIPPAVTLKRRNDSACPDLSNNALTRHPASKLSSVCSCLGLTATTVAFTESSLVTTTESTTSTTTSATTTTTVETESSTTTTTTSTTTTSEILATETAIVDYCNISYNGGGVTPGNTVVRPAGNLDGRACCTLCWTTPNCVSAAVGVGYCQLLIKTAPLAGAPTNLQCPLGIENYLYLDGPGTLFRGPCSPGLN